MKTFLMLFCLSFTNLLFGANFSNYQIEKIEGSRLLFIQSITTTDEDEVTSIIMSVTFVTQEKSRVTCGEYELRQDNKFILHHADFLLEQDTNGNVEVIAIVDDDEPMTGTEETPDLHSIT